MPYGEVLDQDSTWMRSKKNGTTAWCTGVYNTYMQGQICEKHVLEKENLGCELQIWEDFIGIQAFRNMQKSVVGIG